MLPFPLLALQQLLLISLALFHLVGPIPPELGVHEGALAPCPSPAHCARVDWAVADPQAALAALIPVLEAMPRTTVVKAEADYLHATASSALFGFVDDLELHADPRAGGLQARSVSRLGDSDLGVNGRRLETLHQALTITPGARDRQGGTPLQPSTSPIGQGHPRPQARINA